MKRQFLLIGAGFTALAAVAYGATWWINNEFTNVLSRTQTHPVLATKAILPTKPIELLGQDKAAPAVSMAWHDPLVTGAGFCDAAGTAKNYEEPGKQLFAGADGWIFRQEELVWPRRPVQPELHAAVRSMARYLQSSKTKLIVLVSPPRTITGQKYLNGVNVSYRDPRDAQFIYDGLLQSIRQDGAFVPDILGEAGVNAIPYDQLGSPADPHWTTVGAKMAAHATARIIQADVRTNGIKPQVFKISRSGDKVPASDYYNILGSVCATPSLTASVPAFLPIETVGGGASLLGDSAGLSTVITGTSFTAFENRYGYTSFLAEATGLQTNNLSLSGGGPVQALLEYLASGSLQRDKPAFLIWEMSPTNLPDADNASQILAYTNDSCSAAESAEATFDWTDSPIFRETALEKFRSGQTKLSMSSSNAALREFDIVLNKFDGRTDSIPINFARAKVVPKSFKVVLPPLAGVKSISIRPSRIISGRVKATLCTMAE